MFKDSKNKWYRLKVNITETKDKIVFKKMKLIFELDSWFWGIVIRKGFEKKYNDRNEQRAYCKNWKE